MSLDFNGAEIKSIDFTTDSMLLALDYIRIHLFEGYFVSCYTEKLLCKTKYHIAVSKCEGKGGAD